MKNKIIKITLAIISIAILLCILSGCTDTVTNTTNTTNTINENRTINNTTEEECEHDWVITSKYSFWADAYKTISKCSKCGKTVE